MYKINRFRILLFQITGITNISSNFNIAFGLADNEYEDSFEWLIG